MIIVVALGNVVTTSTRFDIVDTLNIIADIIALFNVNVVINVVNVNVNINLQLQLQLATCNLQLTTCNLSSTTC